LQQKQSTLLKSLNFGTAGYDKKTNSNFKFDLNFSYFAKKCELVSTQLKNYLIFLDLSQRQFFSQLLMSDEAMKPIYTDMKIQQELF
jgi:hypothetical protein